MAIWRSTFSWQALSHRENVKFIVTGVLVPYALAIMSTDWFPHYLVISQILLVLASLLCVARSVSVAYESEDKPSTRIVFAILLSAFFLAIGGSLVFVIQKHKHEPAVPPGAAAPTRDPSIVVQEGGSGDCQNIYANTASLNCNQEKQNEKPKRDNKH